MHSEPPTRLPQDIEWRMPRRARSVGRARSLFREQAASWGLEKEVIETAELLLSELMTNAYLHARVPAGREIWARAVLSEGRLRVQVTDASEVLPAPVSPGPAPVDAESGRGLALVAMLADAWGAQRREPGVGKVVWFEMKAGEETPAQGRPDVSRSGPS
ncbi:ATP-binding protein [Streptomyces sp. SID5785]|uniref:ATP-binding protein n=1 Tax=Streptomyces sp. SID5785 TaxID=2690309 RepID=UPI001361A109|nr:ATP-binding protein [Streptomyces sp. SID5785]MZD09761.1 ATP-binding protein [Streptomyces sp. SID5785]